MSAAAPVPNVLPLAEPPTVISDPPPPSVTIPPSSQPNVSAPPPATFSAPPPVTQSPPPVVIAAPPPATPPSATQLPPPSVIAPPPIKPASSSPPPPSEVVSPPMPSLPPPSMPPSEPHQSSPPPLISPPLPPSPPPPSLESPPSLPPPSLESPPSPPPPSLESPPSLSPPALEPPPSPPSPAFEPPTSSPTPPDSTPPKTSPTPPSPNPRPPNSKQPQTSPPPPRKSSPTTLSPPTPPPESQSVNQPPPPPEPVTPSRSPPSPNSIPPSQPSPSSTNASTNLSPPTVLQVAPPPPTFPLVISPPSVNSSPFTPEKSNSNGNGGRNAAIAAGIGVSLGVVALFLIIMLIWCAFKRRKQASLDGRYILPSPYGSSPKAGSTLKVNSTAPLLQSVLTSGFTYSSREPGGIGHKRSWFAYEELVVATDDFSPKNLLGEGGFGYVYKGHLPDGRVIAVKQLKIGGGQGEREFKAEVELISRIHHRHLVSLVGYCVAGSRRLLVYEYISNDSLYFHLHGEGQLPMIWETRVKVAAGAARGLAYLHEDCHPRIIHRDIKSSNILLDNNFEARVSDFGLAKLAVDSYSHVTTRVMGTFGYMAPEYASSGKLTEKSDVYSFGVVLLELITGRKPVDVSQPSGEESLVEWARPLLNLAIETAEFGPLVDPRLEKNYVEAEMFRMIEAAAACVRYSANKRPRMGQVVRFFDSLLAADITYGMQMSQSQVFDSAEHSAEIRLFNKMAFGSHNYNSDFFSDDSQLLIDTRQLENDGSFSNLHYETTHILEVDLESDNQTSEKVIHLHS